MNDDNEGIESKFYSFYLKIFNYWFPITGDYDVCPHWSIPNPTRTEDFTIAFVIEHYHHPLLLVDIKPSLEFQSDIGRGQAIHQVTSHLDEIGPTNLHADRLYAISAIGKRWRACYALKGKGSKNGQPVKGIATKNSLRSANVECWNPDITSNTSWIALKSIVETIKSYA